jgi:hypothetical protein
LIVVSLLVFDRLKVFGCPHNNPGNLSTAQCNTEGGTHSWNSVFPCHFLLALSEQFNSLIPHLNQSPSLLFAGTLITIIGTKFIDPTVSVVRFRALVCVD